jgi:hypothetical protein
MSDSQEQLYHKKYLKYKKKYLELKALQGGFTLKFGTYIFFCNKKAADLICPSINGKAMSVHDMNGVFGMMRGLNTVARVATLDISNSFTNNNFVGYKVEMGSNEIEYIGTYSKTLSTVVPIRDANSNSYLISHNEPINNMKIAKDALIMLNKKMPELDTIVNIKINAFGNNKCLGKESLRVR